MKPIFNLITTKIHYFYGLKRADSFNLVLVRGCTSLNILNKGNRKVITTSQVWSWGVSKGKYNCLALQNTNLSEENKNSIPMRNETEIYKLLKEGNIDKTWKFYLELNSREYKIQRFEFYLMIQQLYKLNTKEEFENISLLFDQAETGLFDFKLEMNDYDIWMQILYKLRKYKEVRNLYKCTLNKFGHPLLPSIYLCLANTFINGESERIYKFYQILRLEGLTIKDLGLPFMNQLLKVVGFYEDGKVLKSLLEEMELEWNTLPSSCIEEIIISFLNNGKLNLAEAWFDELEKSYNNIDIHFFNDVLNCLLKNKLDEVKINIWINKLTHFDLKLNSTSIHLIAKLKFNFMDKGSLVQFVQLFNKFNVQPNSASCFLFFNYALFSTEDINLNILIQNIIQHKDLNIYDALIMILPKEKHVIANKFLINKLKWSKMNGLTYNMVLNRLTYSKNNSQADSFVKWILENPKNYDSFTLSIITKLNNIMRLDLQFNQLIQKQFNLLNNLPNSYDTLLKQQYNNQEFELMEDTFDNIYQDKVNNNLFINLVNIKRYVQFKEFDMVYNIFKEIIQPNINEDLKCDVKLINFIAKQFAVNKQFKYIHMMIQHLLVNKIYFDVELLSNFIEAHEFKLDFNKLLNIINMTKDNNINLNLMFCEQVLRTAIKLNSLSGFYSLVTELTKSIHLSKHFVYTILLKYGEQHLNSMMLSNIYNQITQYDLQLFDNTTFLNLYLNKLIQFDNVNEMKSILNLIIEKKGFIIIEDNTWQLILNLYLKLEYYDSAIDHLFKCIQTYHPSWNNLFKAMINQMVKTLAMNQQYGILDKVLSRYINCSVQPDCYTLHSIVKVVLDGNDLALAEKYILKFKQDFNVTPDAAICNEFIKYFSNTNTIDVNQAEYWFNKIPKEEVNNFTLRVMAKVYFGTNDIAKVNKLDARMMKLKHSS